LQKNVRKKFLKSSAGAGDLRKFLQQKLDGFYLLAAIFSETLRQVIHKFAYARGKIKEAI